jgi:hypothetical protein
MFNDVPAALRPQSNFNNRNMKMYKFNDSNLNEICLSRKKEKLCSEM